MGYGMGYGLWYGDRVSGLDGCDSWIPWCTPGAIGVTLEGCHQVTGNKLPRPPRLRLGLGLGLRLGLEEVFVFDSKRENRDRAVEAVESVSEARAI